MRNLREEGYVNWMWQSPKFGHLLLSVTREDWEHASTIFRDEINPECNANGLYWKYTGIARETKGLA